MGGFFRFCDPPPSLIPAHAALNASCAQCQLNASTCMHIPFCLSLFSSLSSSLSLVLLSPAPSTLCLLSLPAIFPFHSLSCRDFRAGSRDRIAPSVSQRAESEERGARAPSNQSKEQRVAMLVFA
eukprot:217492-Rhodomonas_salina.2